MRIAFAILILLALALPATVPPAAAGVCNPHIAGNYACVGRTVISNDCRVGRFIVNGLFVQGSSAGVGFVIGEVDWAYCPAPGVTYSGHSIDAGLTWYDSNANGARACGVAFYKVDVDMSCAYAPPRLPHLP